MSRQRPGSSTLRRQGSERPAQVGTRRPRSPEPRIQSEPGNLDFITKSPHTARVVKKGKTGLDATHAVDITTTNPIPPQEEHTAPHTPVRAPAPTPSRSTATHTPGVTHVSAESALSMLSSSLKAAAITWQVFEQATKADADPLPTTDIDALLRLIQDLSQKMHKKLMSPEPETPTHRAAKNDPPSTNTYAAAVKAAERPAPSRGAHKAAQTQAHSAPKPQPRTPRTRPKKTRSPRLIIDMDGKKPGAPNTHPEVICESLNAVLPSPARVGAVTFSHIGNLILHPSGPSCTAGTLAGHQDLIWETLRPLMRYETPDKPYFYTSESWHKVVVHGVYPRGPAPNFHEFLQEVHERNGLPSPTDRIGNIRHLTTGSPPPGPISVRVDFIEESDARRFLREGIFLYGSHCRVSRYRPRKRRGLQPDPTA